MGGETGIGQHIRDVQEVFEKIFSARDMSTEGAEFDRLFDDVELFRVGTLTVIVMHTPGHTPACLTYVIGKDAFVEWHRASEVCERNARDKTLAMPTLILPAAQVNMRAGKCRLRKTTA
jgi:hypothetical protein